MYTVFLDRDGVINKKAPDGFYIDHPDKLCLLPDVAKAVRQLNDLDIFTVIVTNQRGVSRGILTEEMLAVIHQKMGYELQKEGARIDKIYYCPHEAGVCYCRKPDIGLFMRAKQEYPKIEFSRSYMIGDSLIDIIAGNKVGCKSILIGDAQNMLSEQAAITISSLQDAVTCITTELER